MLGPLHRLRAWARRSGTPGRLSALRGGPLFTRVTQTPPDTSAYDGQTRTAVPPWPADTQRIWTRSDRANGLHFSSDQKVGGSSPSERATVSPGHKPDFSAVFILIWLVWTDFGLTDLVGGAVETVCAAGPVARPVGPVADALRCQS